ncbi:MAG: hypothetical protein ACR2PZ_20455 [Pseudomonadales bacterium]
MAMLPDPFCHKYLQLPMLGFTACLLGQAVIAAEPEQKALTGRLELGVRTVDISGDRYKYKQHVDLDSGARLFGFDITYSPEAARQSAPDLVAFHTTGVGGDPYQNTRLLIRKYGKYRFRYEHRKSDYFYEDLLIRPEDVDIEASNEGDLHTFDLERTSHRVDFDYQLTQRAELQLAYDRYDREGDGTTVLDIQREEFELHSPIDQALQNLDFGLEYALDKITLTFHERWREFDHSQFSAIDGASEGLDLLGPTRLDAFLLKQPYSYDSREHQLGLLARPTERLRLRADVLVTDLDMDVTSIENADGIDFVGQPFQTRDLATGGAQRDTFQVFLAGSYAISEQVQLTADFREQRMDQEAKIAGNATDGASDWDINTRWFSLGVEVTPTDALHLSAGWSREDRDVELRNIVGTALEATKETSVNDGYWLQLNYRTSDHMDWLVSVENNRVDDAFTSSSATDSLRYRLRGRYRWDNGSLLTVSHRQTEYDNDVSDWRSDSRQSAARISHSGERVTLSMGYTWVDTERSILQLVTGGFRQELFDIDYRADTSFWDVDFLWAPTSRWELSASHRRYRNDGSFDTQRDDSRLGASYALSEHYRISLRYRHIDFEEPPGEDFGANLLEASVGYQF